MANSPERNARNREWMRQWRLNNPEKAKERDRLYRTNRKEQWVQSYRKSGAKYRAADPEKYRQLKHAEYVRNRARKIQYSRSHQSEATERVKKWIALNPDRYKAHRVNGKARRKLRLRATAMHDCTDRICELQKEMQCHWCGAELIKSNRQTDHVIPIAKGGSHSPDNLVASCSKCNLRKNSKLPEEWAKELKEAA